jgi:hypothetical protein
MLKISSLSILYKTVLHIINYTKSLKTIKDFLVIDSLSLYALYTIITGCL